MKRISLFLVAILLLLSIAGCSHTKQITVTHSTTSTIDSTSTTIKERIVEYHDTVFVSVPSESVLSITEQSSSIETSVAVSNAFIDSLGLLHHVLFNKDTSLSTSVDLHVPLSDTTHYESHTKVDSIYVPEPYPVEKLIEKPLKWWQEALMRLGGLVLIAGMVYVAIKVLKRKVHLSS